MLHLFINVLLATAVLPAQESVYLVAFDRQGQPIADLKSNELKLLDNGRAQVIAFLARLDKASSSPTVFLYDLLNTGIYSRATVQQQIVQALQNLPPNVPTYLYLLNGDAQLLPIHGVGAAESPSWPKEADFLLDGVLRNTSTVRPNNLSQVGARVNATYTALIHVAAEIAHLDGHKNLVWITHGVPLQGISADDTPIDYLPILQEIAAGLAHEQIVIYPVQQTAGALPGAADTSPDTLREVAVVTGGRAFLTETVDKAPQRSCTIPLPATCSRSTRSQTANSIACASAAQGRGFASRLARVTSPNNREPLYYLFSSGTLTGRSLTVLHGRQVDSWKPFPTEWLPRK